MQKKDLKYTNREDYDLGWLLQYENVAWFDEDDRSLRILDRRIYPLKTEFVICKEYEQTVQAIKDMVTQSGGPFAAAAMGMALAAHQFKNLSKEDYLNAMQKAAYNLSHARPTTSAEMERCTNKSFLIFKKLIEEGTSSSEIIKALKLEAINQNNIRYKKNTQAGALFANLVPDKSALLTQCFGETATGGFLRAFNKSGKNVKIYCAETRPFFQGSRLTASLAADMGFDTTVITDNMPALLMSEKKIDFAVSASDVITTDGAVINKIGTLQIAVCAKYFGIPYYAIGFPDEKYSSAGDVKIEYRNGADVLNAMGIQTANKGVKGLYPAFDITPPALCTGIVTDTEILNIK